MTKANFNEYKLSEDLLKAIDLLKFNSPTKVQEQVIPAALDQKDIIVKSQTGSGKTAAFAIPVCQLIDWEQNLPQALVITPTRELAIQVKEDFFNIGRFKRLKVSAIYGKASIIGQEKELKQKTHVVVGTPGRIIDLLERKAFDPSAIRYLIIDEADELLNMGFIAQVETILNSLPDDRVTMLFSATMPNDIGTLCNRYMKQPVQIEIEEQNTALNRIRQERYSVEQSEKIELLKDIMTVENPDSCIIFCNAKQTVEEVYQALSSMKFACEKMHGGMEQRDRLRGMDRFKKGLFRYLIATDVAARGIDIDHISLVINFDIPRNGEIYTHRIGRTGRIGNKGIAITFVSKSETNQLTEIHQYLGNEIQRKDRPNQETVALSKQEFVEKISTAPKPKEAKGARLGQEIVKLHINAGKKTKMRPADIVGTLCSLEGMTVDDIGIINIIDVSTFVEILNNKGELVYEALQNTPIKGRLRKVSRAEVQQFSK